MKTSELKALSIEELQNSLSSAESGMQNLKFAHAVSPIENPTRIKAARKDVARVKTELHARTLELVAEKVKSGELTSQNARTFLKESKLPSPIKLAKLKQLISRFAN